MTSPPSGFFDVVVTRRQRETPDVISLALAPTANGSLPEWEPGAHVDVRLPSGLIRQYSLCGESDGEYVIAVLRETDGRGRSAELHTVAQPDTLLSIRGPRNHFALVEADEYVLLAGGIGITPIIAMARQLCVAGKPWRLYYGGRSRSTMAFLEELNELDGEVTTVPEDEAGLLDLPGILASTAVGTAVYCCGPAPMIKATEQLFAQLRTGASLHIERFSSAEPDGSMQRASGRSFEVELRRSGLAVTVDANQTILAAVRAVLPEVPSSCEDGYCGTCETPVLEGIPEHHDDILSDAERDANDTMMICVGRSKSPRLVLDL